MAIISHQNQYMYFLNPRTASTATASALEDHAAGFFLPEKAILDENGHALVQRKHSTLSQLIEHELITTNVAETYFKFVTVRNPFDSIVSIWAKKSRDYVKLLDDPNSWVHRIPGYTESMRKAAGKTFREWVLDVYKPKVEAGKQGNINQKYTRRMDYVMRYENVQVDLDRIASRVGLPRGFILPVKNRTSGRSLGGYREYYDPETREIISRYFEKELCELGYCF